MDFLKKIEKTGEGYIFLSHSHKDINKVRQIRNQLEEEGFEPLCFYLKCLEDADEIEDLIKREIDAREWFIFINSDNSRSSKWVSLERDYIAKVSNKKVLTIDIDDEDSINKTLHKIKENLRVFFTYAQKDTSLARQIQNAFGSKDYQVFFPTDDIFSYEDTCASVINQAHSVVALITENSVSSKFVEHEISQAIIFKKQIFPIIVGNVELDLTNPIWNELASYNCFFLSEFPTNEMIDNVIDKIGKFIVKM